MIIPINIYKIKRVLRDQWSLFVSFGVFVLLFLLILIFYARFNEQKNEVQSMDNEVLILKNRVNTLEYNKSITEDQVKEYNKLLTSLVPEIEDFFSIIYALEEIGKISQFTITDYTVDTGRTSNGKLTLVITGRGNPNSFLKFLQEYQFAGGRLVTSDKIQYGGTVYGSTKVALNFYSRQFTFNALATVPQLSKEEIVKLNLIKQKVRFQISTSAYQSVSTDYATKKDPFSGE